MGSSYADAAEGRWVYALGENAVDEEEYLRRWNDLKSRITDEFLETLVEAARIEGWMSDYHETKSFVQNVFCNVGKEPPDPFPDPY